MLFSKFTISIKIIHQRQIRTSLSQTKCSDLFFISILANSVSVKRSLIFDRVLTAHTARRAVARASAFFVLFIFQKREYRDPDQNKDHRNYNDRYGVVRDPRKHYYLLLSFSYIFTFCVSLVASLYFLKKSI